MPLEPPFLRCAFGIQMVLKSIRLFVGPPCVAPRCRVHPQDGEVANAVGAAIPQVGSRLSGSCFIYAHG